MLENAAAAVVVVALLATSAWLIDRLATYSRNMTCLTTNQRSCRIIAVDTAPRQPVAPAPAQRQR